MPSWRNLKINNCATRQADVVVNNNSVINIPLLLVLLLSLLSSLLLSSSIFKVPVLSTATDIKNPTVTSSTNHNTSPTVVVDAFQYQQQQQQQRYKYKNNRLVQKIIQPSNFFGRSCCPNGIITNTKVITKSATAATTTATRTQQGSGRMQLVMRDRSASYWFTKGDTVQVVEDVYMNNNRNNLRNRIGTVVETWEKCQVDPTCCCAEQVDLNYAVRVVFDNTDTKNEIHNNSTTTSTTITSTSTSTSATRNDSSDHTKKNNSNGRNTDTSTSNGTNTAANTNIDTNTNEYTNETESLFYYYFAEDELIKL